ncbi:hypothetical protein [Paraclostridium sordellii]|uniref:hypothetical protein n=1 Tax=Paraclostridium sordellii TaxID=1505 RepID=UPI0013DF0831|nr:hypothetical protein [Paeniclostridium sordellii]
MYFIFDHPLLSDITSTFSLFFKLPIIPCPVDGPLLTFNDVAVTTFVFVCSGGVTAPPSLLSFKYVLDT